MRLIALSMLKLSQIKLNQCLKCVTFATVKAKNTHKKVNNINKLRGCVFFALTCFGILYAIAITMPKVLAYFMQ
jgi:hypothetical protein